MSDELRPLSVVLAGGGTAGHVEPAMAVADALREIDPTVRITALGTERGLETRLVPDRGYHLELIVPVPLPRRLTGDLVRLPLRVRRAVRQTRAVFDGVQADVVIGFGGYVALPAYLAARRGPLRRRRVPVVIHEANARAGLANRVGARGAQRVLSAVPDSGLRDAEVVGVPVRGSITALDRAALRHQHVLTTGLMTMPWCYWCSAVRRERSPSTTRFPQRPMTLPPPVFRCCMHMAQRTRLNCRSARLAHPDMLRCRTWTAWTWRTRPRISRCADPVL